MIKTLRAFGLRGTLWYWIWGAACAVKRAADRLQRYAYGRSDRAILRRAGL